MKIDFLGATKEVGRSAILVEQNRRRSLLDYGIRVDKNPGLPLPVQGFVDDVIISHAHLDHSGAVPLLYKVTEPKTYMTPPTLPMIDLLVKDSIKIREMEGLEKIFTNQHLKRMLRNTVKIPYSQKKEIGKDTSIKFEDAGHILGASTVRMDTPEGNILYTGDFKSSETALHKPAYDYKDEKNDIDILITEATYGDEEHPPREKIEKEFYKSVQRTVEEGGNALIPAFAIGRSQEVITVLEKHGFEGQIWLDGMSTDAADIMLNYPEYINRFDDFYEGMKKANWINEHRERYEAMEEPGAIVTTAGMLGGGPIIHYLSEIRKKKQKNKHGIYLTGYQPEDTPGKRLLETGRFVHDRYDIDFSEFEIEFYDFSAHGDKHELKRFAEKINPEVTFVVHGDEENTKALGNQISKNVDTEVIIPELNESYDIEDYI